MATKARAGRPRNAAAASLCGAAALGAGAAFLGTPHGAAGGLSGAVREPRVRPLVRAPAAGAEGVLGSQAVRSMFAPVAAAAGAL